MKFEFKALSEENVADLYQYLDICKHISLGHFKKEVQPFLDGYIDVEGEKKQAEYFLVYHQGSPISAFYFYDTHESQKGWAVLKLVNIKKNEEPSSEEVSMIEQFLNEVFYKKYTHCITDIDHEDLYDCALFAKAGFKVHTHLNDFSILKHEKA
jgi:hypothetical protein